MKRKLVLLMLLLAILLGLLYWKNTSGKGVQGPADTPNPLAAVTENQGKKPLFIDFTSDDCTYCVKMKPVIAELQVKYQDKVIFIIANTGKNAEARQLAYFYKVTGIPAFFIHDRDGVITDRFVGLTKKDTLDQALQNVSAD